MYAAIRRYEGIESGAVPEVMRRVEAGLLPEMRNIPGFVAYYALDAGAGVITRA